MTAGRIRVLIAGNIYVKRALVRRFLEDDGYEVVAEALTRSDILPAIRRGGPDAIVVDDELLDDGAMARIRKAAPDAKVIVFTSTPPSAPAAMVGADAYLEKGVGLAALTALLGRLFDPERSPLALVGAGAVAVGTLGKATSQPTDVEATMDDNGSGTSTTTTGGGAPARLIAIAGGAILIVVGLIAMITTGGGTEPAPADTTDQTDGTVIAEPAEQTELDAAYAALDEMIAAIEGGNYVLATVQAQALMDAREDAFAAGFSTSGLDAEVTARLEVVVVGIPAGAATNLQGILGDLYPVLEDESTPGGGSDVVLGETVTNDGGSTSGGGTTDGTTGGGGGGEGGGGGGATVGPGDGKEWGQSHKETKGEGGPPPWSNGHHNKK